MATGVFAIGGSGYFLPLLGVLALMVIAAALGAAAAVAFFRRGDPATRAALGLSYLTLAATVAGVGTAAYSIVAAIGAPTGVELTQGLQRLNAVGGATSCAASTCTNFFVDLSIRDRAISAAVATSALALTSAAAYAVIWPRARRRALALVPSAASAYGVLVAASAGVGLLVTVPMSLYGLYEAIDPRLAGTRRAGGVGDCVGALIATSVSAALIRSHLRLWRSAGDAAGTVDEGPHRPGGA